MAKAAEHLLLPALFFVSFFWASKRKKRVQLNSNTNLASWQKILKQQTQVYDSACKNGPSINSQPVERFLFRDKEVTKRN
ncbi:MAG: hypothetical protein E6H06_10605 [Bacteroidetes bacterium]|nr:MAG: hypothetical protein E6H06_10605 [Bacteroidota bacterium]